MVTIKPEPGASPAAQAAANAPSSKRKRASARLKAEAGGSIAGAGAAAVAIKAEAASGAVCKSEGDDGGVDVDAGLFGKLNASWASLDCTSTATEESPYPKLSRPHPLECFFVNDALSALHGEPIKKELEEDCSGKGTLLEKRAQSVLDSLVRTILSQNTTDKLSAQAFAQLKQQFPTWKAALAAPAAQVEAAIKIGGLAQIKWGRIRVILETILEERPRDCPKGEPSLEWLRALSVKEVKEQLGRFKGVGPKTISCVLMFTIGSPHEFPVDTHVWFIAKRLGWVPPSAGREETYSHLNSKVPDQIKYSLHVLLVRHGKSCRACCKGALQLPEIEGPCPLTALASGKMRQQLLALAEELGEAAAAAVNKTAGVKKEQGDAKAASGGGKKKRAKVAGSAGPVIKKEV